MRPVAVLRYAWDEKAYTRLGAHKAIEREHGDGGAAFDPSALTLILLSALFRAYSLMLLKLKLPVARLQAWCEGCPCHQGILLVRWAVGKKRLPKGSSVRARMRADGLVSGICPLMSCRLCELVHGELDRLLRELEAAVRDSLAEIVLLCQTSELLTPMTDVEITLVTSDFYAGLSTMCVMLQVKFAWAKNLPWKLAGMGHPHISEAQAMAKACIDIYDKTPKHMSHRKSHLLLEQGGRLRSQVEIFARTGLMHEELETEVSILCMIPISDRPIEAEHILPSQVAKSSKAYRLGHNFSLRRRLTIASEFQSNPDVERRFIDAFAEIQLRKNIVEKLGFASHPAFAAGTDHWIETMRLLERLVYRQDIALKYERYISARRTNQEVDLADRKSTRACRKKVAAPIRSGDDILLANALPHLKSVAKTLFMITGPSKNDGSDFLIGQGVDELLHPTEALAIADGADGDEPMVDGGDDGERPSKRPRQAGPRVGCVGPDLVDGLSLLEFVARENPEHAEGSPHVCFRILATSLGKAKTISTFVNRTGAVLMSDDFAITNHQMLSLADNNMIAELEPMKQFGGGSGSSHVMVVTDFVTGSSFERLQASVLGWSPDRKNAQAQFMLHQVDGLAQEVVQDAVSQLFAHHAVEGSNHVLEADSSILPWHSLLRSEHVVYTSLPNHQEGLQLSRSAMSCLRVCTRCCNPRPVFALRNDLALEDMTNLELALALKERG